jgi:hypothetical protein
MSCHLTGNSCHIYGRAYIRTQLQAEPQYPVKKTRDLDNYMTQVDVVLLMMFSNFYKQRMLPSEIYEFFVNNKTDIEDLDIETNIDYLKGDMQRLKTAPRVKFAEKIEVRDEDEIDPGKMPHPRINPIIQMHHDYIKTYMM